MTSRPRSIKEEFEALPERYYQHVDITEWPEWKKDLLRQRLAVVEEERKEENKVVEMYKWACEMDVLRRDSYLPPFLRTMSPTNLVLQQMAGRAERESGREIVNIPLDLEFGPQSTCIRAGAVVDVDEERKERMPHHRDCCRCVACRSKKRRGKN